MPKRKDKQRMQGLRFRADALADTALYGETTEGLAGAIACIERAK